MCFNMLQSLAGSFHHFYHIVSSYFCHMFSVAQSLMRLEPFLLVDIIGNERILCLTHLDCLTVVCDLFISSRQIFQTLKHLEPSFGITCKYKQCQVMLSSEICCTSVISRHPFFVSCFSAGSNPAAICSVGGHRRSGEVWDFKFWI